MSADSDTGATVTPPERIVIGLSFGNSYSGIAHTSSDGKPVVIANEDGDRQIPSVLSYIDGEEYYGTPAKGQLVRNPTNTVACFRDFLGKTFDAIDPTPCHGSAHAQKEGNGVAFSIRDTSSETPSTVSVEEITTRHLKALASSASNFLGTQVNAAVVTVPTNFTDAQKKALSEAAQAAGLEILQVIAEPVAALLAYDARAEVEVHDRLVVVADLGGTRSDVAVVAARGGMYTVLATTHDYEFAGVKLDGVLVEHFAKDFVKKHKSDPREDPRGLAKLQLEAEATKKALSIGTNAGITIESLTNGIDFHGTINRTRYELLASKIFAGLGRLVADTVRKAELDPLDITEVLLAGGTAHTPRLATNIAGLFPKAKVLAPATEAGALNPSELHARGAAIQASLIQSFDATDIDQSAHPMVTATPHLAHAVGVALIAANPSQSLFYPILPAETAVPVRRTVVVGAPRDGGAVLIRLCEGAPGIKVTKPAPKPKTNGKPEADEEDSDEDDSDEEEDEIRERVIKQGSVLAETAVRGLPKSSKVEIMVNVNAELGVQFTARQVGGAGGVRVTVEKPGA